MLRIRHCLLSQVHPGVPSSEKPQLSNHQNEFLKEFREKLRSGDSKADLDSFIEEAARPISLSSLPPVPKPQRGTERLPSWLKLQIPKGLIARPKYNKIKNSMRAKGLATVCEEAKCPNIGECWGGGSDAEDGTATATIMMMGDTCTRGCRFCAVKTSRTPPPLDPAEPEKICSAVADMGVEYIVITMVDRDDLPDGGATHVAKTLNLIKTKTSVLVECLSGDFRGNGDHLALVARSGLDVYAHNIECVERITPRVRDRRAGYKQSLTMLEHAKRVVPTLVTKSSIMLGLGEQEQEIRQTLQDLRAAGVECLTLGQYLQPSATRMKVDRYVHPDEFEAWRIEAEQLGFLYCASGPMVRSSYRAGEFYMTNVLRARRGQNFK